MLRNTSALLLALLSAGCASYTTPGATVRLQDIDIADSTARRPSPNFPARIVVVRVQAPRYRSETASGLGSGKYSIVTAPELFDEEQVKTCAAWPSVEGVAPMTLQDLPDKLRSLDDLRLAAAKLQADVMLTYTVDTAFQVQGHRYGPLEKLPLGTAPDAAANVSSTATATFTDVRTGFNYGSAQASATVNDLAAAWKSPETVDAKRLEAERGAVTALLQDAQTTWSGITQRYQ